MQKKTSKAPAKPAKKKKTPVKKSDQKFSLKRLIMGEEKPDLTELEAGSTTILDILSPTTIDTKSRDYIVVDGVFHAYLYVTGYGYSTTVGSCWLAPLVEAGEGVNLSFIFKRQSKEKILSKIAQTTMVNRSRMRDVGDTRQDFEELDSAISSGLYLKDVMNRQGEDFYYMHTLIEVTADDPETLEQRVTAVEKLCVSIDMIARRCDYKNEQAFLSALPLLSLDADVERKSRRNALTSGVAAAFPFASYELSDRNGVFLGLNLYNRSPVFLDPYDDYKYTKPYRSPSVFDAEYGVVENTYETTDADYNANRRVSKRRTKTRQLPGVSPLVFSRFLLEYTAFLSLNDMGKDLPDYEEIPIPIEMPEDIWDAYKEVEREIRQVLKSDRKAAQKLLSAYLNLLTVYPDQPYDQLDIVHPIDGHVIAHPSNEACFEDILPKEEKVLEIVREKIAAGERVMIYTSWTRTDSQQKLVKLLTGEGVRTEILSPAISPDKREAWVEKKVRSGCQVLITNPRCVETGLDLNAFTTLIFYSMGYNLFTLRQAARRSWRINQTAPRVEVYILYYADTMQAKAMKLMASKLAVAGIIEGNLSEEGLAAMSDVKDLTSQMAKELALGIKDNVEDIAAAFKKMAIINPNRERIQPVALPMQKYFDYLDQLRQSGKTNMFGAVPYLQKQFFELSVDRKKAAQVLQAWMDSHREKEGEDK